MSFESFVDKQIREATERGEFDDLPGKGKPIPGCGEAYDELWWVKGLVAREKLGAGGLPESLRLKREIEDLPAAVKKLRSERAVRQVMPR